MLARPAPVLNPLPLGVWALCLLVAGVEAVLWAGGAGLIAVPGAAGWRLDMVAKLAVTPDLQGWMQQTRTAPLPHLLRYLGFGMVHLGPAQAGMVLVMLAALGRVVALRLGSTGMLALLVVAQAAGAVAFGAFAPPGALLVGGYPLLFALAGAWVRLADPAERRRALVLVGLLLLGRGALALALGGAEWLADLVAFCIAAFLAPVFRPGLIARLRRA